MPDHADFEMGQRMDAYGDSPFNEPKNQLIKQCRVCGEGGLTWLETPNGWKLAKGQEVHKCQIVSAPELIKQVRAVLDKTLRNYKC